ELGTKVSKNDTITVDDVLIEREQYVYVLLNKPRETISTTDDPKNRDTVVELIADVEERIYPVGRLDWDTTGALLLTNDGELSYKLTHPSFEFTKTYVVKTKGRISKKLGNQLAQGILLDGRKTAPAMVSILSYDRPSDTTVARITLHEGRNYEVKKMIDDIRTLITELTHEDVIFHTT